MPNFNTIIEKYAALTYLAGGDDANTDEDNKKRESLIIALKIREAECSLRFKIALGILLFALGILIYFYLFQPEGVKAFKELTSILGGGSVVAVLFYIISIRDELTKVKQTSIIATAVDSVTLNTMLLTLSAK